MQRQAVAYIMVEASGLGFCLVLWVQENLVNEPEEFTPLYQGRSKIFLEGDNLTTRIEESVANGELKDVELFVSVDNLVSESVFYNGASKSPLLFETVLRLHQVQMRWELILHAIHIEGTRMI